MTAVNRNLPAGIAAYAIEGASPIDGTPNCIANVILCAPGEIVAFIAATGGAAYRDVTSIACGPGDAWPPAAS